MRIFTTACKDTLTKMELILSNCSFNAACAYLESQPLGEYRGCESLGKTTTKILFEKRNFYYDEERGYLLGA